ncbi:UDP:flavonoid glycosyltransferase YjiC (YdhE family) [Catenuloplanes nepalensis]|uniref:UDP:flavonoid glycosyltransferase YjiC (YdhE family) n=1 Tax=Catenuloplanes nepalensis TaxID=587533 RepID=A0ABT9MQR2_9ACTN|nr:glycosyltransferase [Catenuloplanes nepalensis]MDP9793636.1 UDP:flavonoid glycosyltransferase YjiC (YdhE family) [Catenuloplanes nepalensis]
MRVLFSCVPAIGHTFPLLPLARAFARRGDRVAFLTAAGMTPVLANEGFALLPAGPMPDVLFAEAAARTGQDAAAEPTPASVSAFFGEVRLDTTADDAITAARDWAPDLIVNEMTDTVGPLVAAVLGTPQATLSFGPGIPPEFRGAIAANIAPYFTARGVDAPATLPAGRWVLDLCPDILGPVGIPDGMTRLPLRPEAHRGPDGDVTPALPPAAAGRPRVLVTFGSHFGDPEIVLDLLNALQDGVDADVIGTALPGAAEPGVAEPGALPGAAEPRLVPFQPMAKLLPGVSAVVTHGGAGTVLGALSLGLPVVVVPQGADQFVQAAAVSAAGCGVATAPGRPDPETLRAAVKTVLTDPAIAAAAADVRKQMDAMPSPDEVAATLAAAL